MNFKVDSGARIQSPDEFVGDRSQKKNFIILLRALASLWLNSY